MRKLNSILALGPWVLMPLSACGHSNEETAATPPSAPTVAPVVQAAEPAPAPRFDEASFAISAAVPEVHAGQEVAIPVTIRAKGEFHLNADYPTHVTVRVPAGVTTLVADVGKDKATSFAEREGVFPLQVTASTAGDVTVQADVDFAVCTEQNCQPETRTLLIPLHVL